MYELYGFLTGTGMWISSTICIGGLILRLAFLFGLSRERDRVFYNHLDIKWAARSILRWLLPWGSLSLRGQPVFAAVIFVFHLLLFCIPLFLLAHNVLWYEAFGWRLWSLPEGVSDTLTLVLLGCALFLFVRRLVRPEVRIMTTAWDYSLLLLTALPFLSGFLASHGVGPYQPMLVLHVLAAEVVLIVIPFSKLAHVVLFFFSRAFIGFEMGERRGAHPW